MRVHNHSSADIHVSNYHDNFNGASYHGPDIINDGDLYIDNRGYWYKCSVTINNNSTVSVEFIKLIPDDRRSSRTATRPTRHWSPDHDGSEYAEAGDHFTAGDGNRWVYMGSGWWGTTDNGYRLNRERESKAWVEGKRPPVGRDEVPTEVQR